MADAIGEGRRKVVDLDRVAQPGEPPVAGAQWDELHGRWLVWDEAAETWLIVGDEPGELILPLDEIPLPPPLLALKLSHEAPARDHVVDVDRLARPPQPMRGAQWNEVAGRWERWHDATGEWVEAVAVAQIQL
jgi:hypothetical protein